MAQHGGARKGAGRKKGIGLTYDIQKHCQKFIKEILKDDAIKYKAIKQLSLGFESENEEDYFYVIKNNGLYKLGYSSNWNRRFKNYKTHLGDVELVFLTKQKGCFEIEQYMHETFKEKRRTGEWFDLLDNDLFFIIKYCSNNL